MALESSKPAVPLRSLEDIHSSVPIPSPGWRRFLAFSGPAFLVSVGYMDPGNWGTDLAAGSGFGYRLVWVLLMSNVMAVVFQTLAARLGVVTGKDLAQACRESYPRATVWTLWILCEIAIGACDLAEVIGTIIALKLLFNLPYLYGLGIAAADTFLLLALQRRGVRLLELVTLTLIGVIAVSFFVEIVLARPDWSAVTWGFVPSLEPGRFGASLYVAISMLGATVMPHNLYLHSALVQTRSYAVSPRGRAQACKYYLLDSLVALNGAFLVNAAILILAAAKFAGREVETLQKAYQLLPAALGTTLASALFAIALLASGQSSTLTGTLAGQVVMEGFVRLHLRPWMRRLLTRSLALLPAVVLVVLAGREGTGDVKPDAPAPTAAVSAAEPSAPGAGEVVPRVDRALLQLLILSQVVLSLQLPFAIVPLVLFTSDRRRMAEFASRGWVSALAWGCATVVIVLNAVLIVIQIQEWATTAGTAGWSPGWVYGPVGGLTLALGCFLVWVGLYPYLVRRQEAPRPVAAPALPGISYRRIGVGVELEGRDDAVLAQAAALARVHGAVLVPIHVVEGFGAAFHGPETDAEERRSDQARLAELVEHLRADGLPADGVLGYGSPPDELVRLAQQQQLDLLVLGTHGHRFLADMALGRTVSPLLHRLTIPVLVVPGRPAAEKTPVP